jgi:hypothetical protein
MAADPLEHVPNPALHRAARPFARATRFANPTSEPDGAHELRLQELELLAGATGTCGVVPGLRLLELGLEGFRALAITLHGLRV